jgi:hypothetical protein
MIIPFGYHHIGSHSKIVFTIPEYDPFCILVLALLLYRTLSIFPVSVFLGTIQRNKL